MKKLVAAGCCVFLFYSFSKVSAVNNFTEQKTSDGRILIRAIAGIVNTEANKKLPAKRIFIASSEPPF